MSRFKIAVISVSLFALLFQFAIYGFDERIVYVIFATSPFMMIWLVYTVLKHGKPIHESFDDKFYEDHPYRRNGKEEMSTEAEEMFPKNLV